MSDAVSPVLFRAADRPGPAAVGPGMGEEALGLNTDAPSPHPVHKVGPNAVIQTRLALIDICGAGHARALFSEAGLVDWFDLPPDSMVSAEPVNRLNMTLFRQLESPVFEMLMADAGVRTGRYILENRIPRPVRRLLQNLPVWLAARALLKAIRAHAWTFAEMPASLLHRVTPQSSRSAQIRSPSPAAPGTVACSKCCFPGFLESLSMLIIRPCSMASHAIASWFAGTSDPAVPRARPYR
jgi:bacteriochlorophyll 4-vinyl reductase